MLDYLPVQVLKDNGAVHRFYHQVLFVLLFISSFPLVVVCLWEPYKLFDGVNASGENGGLAGVIGLGAGDTDCTDGPKRK